MTPFFIFDAPNEAFFEWLPFFRNVHGQTKSMILALDAALFPTARWALPKVTLRPLAADLRDPVPSSASLHAFLRNVQEIAPNPVCVFNGSGSYVKDLVHAFLPLSTILEVILADTNGRFRSRDLSPGVSYARGTVDFNAIVKRLGFAVDRVDVMKSPSDADLNRVFGMIQSSDDRIGPYIIASFDLDRTVTGSGADAVARITKLVSARKKRLLDLKLFEVTRRSPYCSGVQTQLPHPLEVSAPDLACLIYGSRGVLTNNPAVAHLSAQIGRACLAIWAGRNWQDHAPHIGPGIVLGADVPVRLGEEFPLGFVPLETLVEVVNEILADNCLMRNLITVQPSREFLIEYIETVIYDANKLSLPFSAPTNFQTYLGLTSNSIKGFTFSSQRVEER
jgi:hypothetical protein